MEEKIKEIENKIIEIESKIHKILEMLESEVVINHQNKMKIKTLENEIKYRD